MVVVVASVSFFGDFFVFVFWETEFFCGSIVVVVVVVGSLLFRAPRGVCVCSPTPSPPFSDFPLSSLFLTSYRVFVVNLHLYVCSFFYVCVCVLGCNSR